ncbi:terminase family protein (plasmid) [Kitasatospora sp. NBC_01246]|uniref:terminase large subunit domain-containing protein n=1 Tax=Kitasatospora sp. NBC_01246 TaxID=2903570 RepID=UPI002E3241D7|nr:terminase family protein [Kitasatospora sp. NBC_01246]
MGKKHRDPEAELTAVIEQYKKLSPVERELMANQVKAPMRAHLARAERGMLMDRSPGRMATVMTDGIELQAPHLDLIDNLYRRIAAGERIKAMVEMPPRHGKSQRASRWGPLWFLRRQPLKRVMLASYGSELADDHGRWVRDQIGEHTDLLGIKLHPGSRAASRFDLLAPPKSGVRGGMVTAGVGGSLTGKGFDLGIVDDPFKGSDDASSPAQRDRVWEWYRSVFYTRRAPGASQIIINTRWHEDDLCGRILQQDPDGWERINLPAIADSPDDILGRPIGAALWPSRYDEQDLADTRKAVGERIWWSLYQQRPRPMEGGVWKWPWISDNRISPQQLLGINLTRVVVFVDPSGGDTQRDEVGVVAAGRDAKGDLYVLADRSAQMGAEQWGRAACQLAIDLRADAIGVENNFGGDMARQVIAQAWAELDRENLTRGLLRPRLIDVFAKQGKRLRAEPIAQLYAQALVHHVGEFVSLEGQMVTWMAGMDSPDRMDAAVHALTELAEPASSGPTTGTYTRGPLPGRR